ncbi:hypothetical protein EZ456_08680 [Pedobacter psychrodurus]|uniref:Uncharacterized protein n=1 Tax=Pedobacter psychrodurus TaxID=2530456 RepID=A0A4R0PY84_9SPHI|nr:hypothetical protein [Pedobacter psychrodurus]TCD27269.1 hypothetical protein EZ456_08680 [Pedobacter psychrodurus]
MKTLNMLKVRGILLFSLFILWATIGKSQVSYFGAALLNSQKLEAFKKTTTLFTLQYADYAELEKFDRAIKKNWTITPYKIIKPEELARYDTLSNYSFFYFDGYAEQLDSTTNVNVVYALKLITPSKKPKVKEESILATVTLFPDRNTNLLVETQDQQYGSKRSIKNNILSNLYNKSNFLNWSPGFLTGYLKRINDGLLANENCNLDYQFYNKVRLPELAKETLYIPEYIKEVFSSRLVLLPQSGIISEPYNYKLKFVSYKMLDSLILSKETKIKYVVYTQRSNDKIISVYDSKDDKIIYQHFYPQSTNFEMNDLSEIKKVIISLK